MQFVNQDSQIVRLTIDLSLGDWRKVQERLGANPSWPGSDLSQTITDAIRKVNRSFEGLSVEEVE